MDLVAHGGSGCYSGADPRWWPSAAQVEIDVGEVWCSPCEEARAAALGIVVVLLVAV
jgi:hypothetical protein